MLLLAALTSTVTALGQSGWTLTWQDEFTTSAVDSTKWTYDIGGNGWGNKEWQTYTSRPQNAYIDNGVLVIEVIAEKHTGPDGITRNYTSARLKTLGKFSQTYGRFEARIKLPYGQGIWPAFWMMGDDLVTVDWPACGEIDIMENIGKVSEQSTVHGTLHGPGYSGGSGLSAKFMLPGGKRFADEFYVFAVEWEPAEIRWYVDDHHYQTLAVRDLPAGAKWVFDHPFHMLLNVAVGGNWPGYPDRSTVFPQTMQVDYVRVYKRTAGR